MLGKEACVPVAEAGGPSPSVRRECSPAGPGPSPATGPWAVWLPPHPGSLVEKEETGLVQGLFDVSGPFHPTKSRVGTGRSTRAGWGLTRVTALSALTVDGDGAQSTAHGPDRRPAPRCTAARRPGPSPGPSPSLSVSPSVGWLPPWPSKATASSHGAAEAPPREMKQEALCTLAGLVSCTVVGVSELEKPS